jgi:hypothetical protein
MIKHIYPIHSQGGAHIGVVCQLEHGFEGVRRWRNEYGLPVSKSAGVHTDRDAAIAAVHKEHPSD